MNKNVVLSFSGGKDSCLALYELQQQGINVACLITTVLKENQETVAHNEKLERIEAQAHCFNIPVHFIETEFNTYTDDFVHHLQEVKNKYQLDGAAFGDIYLEGHLKWGEQVTEKAGLEAIYPLWTKQENVVALLYRFIELGFKAEIIKVDETKLPENWVGRQVDESFMEDILLKDVCPMGESGEYHTYVYDGPTFDKK